MWNLYEKGDLKRNLSRVILSKSVTVKKIDWEVNCNIKNISKGGAYLRVEIGTDTLLNKNAFMKNDDITIFFRDEKIAAKVIWVSNPVLNLDIKDKRIYYAYFGVNFVNDVSQSFLLEQIALNALDAWKYIRALRLPHDNSRRIEDDVVQKAIKHLSSFRAKGALMQGDAIKKAFSHLQGLRDARDPELSELDGVHIDIWYYYPAECIFLKNTMEKNNECQYGSLEQARVTELMNETLPVLSGSKAKKFFHCLNTQQAPSKSPKEEGLWYFPLIAENEFIGLVQFFFTEPMQYLFRVDRIFWLCTHIAEYFSQEISTQELKRDTDFEEIIEAISRLGEDSQKYPLNDFYDLIQKKISTLLGNAPGVLYLYAPNSVYIHNEKNPEESFNSPSYVLCASSLDIEMYKIDLVYPTTKIGSPNDLTCGQNSYSQYSRNSDLPIICGADFYRVDFLVLERTIGVAFFKTSQESHSMPRLSRRIKKVAETLSRLLERGILSYVENQERKLLETQGLLAPLGGEQSLLVPLLKEVCSILDARVCTLFWVGESGLGLYPCATSKINYYNDDGSRNFKFHAEWEDVSKKYYSINSPNLTPLVVKKKQPIAVPYTRKWHKENRIDPIVRDTTNEAEGPFMGIPLFGEYDEQQNRKVIGVLRCSKKKTSKYNVFNYYDLKLLSNLGNAITPLLITTFDRMVSSRRIEVGGHEVNNLAELIISTALKVNENISNLMKIRDEFSKLMEIKDFSTLKVGNENFSNLMKIRESFSKLKEATNPMSEHTPSNIEDAAELLKINANDMQYSSIGELSWEKTDESISLFGDVIKPIAYLSNISYKNFVKLKYKGKDIPFRTGKIECEKWKNVYNDIPMLRLDKKRMQQLFFNLLNNAIKHSRFINGMETAPYFGSIYTSCETKDITIRPRYDYARKILEIEIISDGIEILESEREVIFDHGKRGAETLRLTAGYGMGLSICRKITETANLKQGNSLENKNRLLDLYLQHRYEPIVFIVRININKCLEGLP
jgi:signal transduction histidine kinase